MLVLRLARNEEVVLFDRKTTVELGRVKFLEHQHPGSNKVNFGFDLCQDIQVLRAKLVKGKGVKGRQ